MKKRNAAEKVLVGCYIDERIVGDLDLLADEFEVTRSEALRQIIAAAVKRHARKVAKRQSETK